jgi:tetratricopeptide (TPR) repeat protein
MRRWLALWLVVTGISFAGIVSGCAQMETDPASNCVDGDGQAPVDSKLLAFLSKAKSAHHIADQYEEDKELQKAIEVLRKLLDGSAPSSPEVREVLADTRARVADLESQLGNFDVAAKDIDAGLELAKEVTYFRGHLFEVRGMVEERRGKAEAQKGDEKAAEASKKRALEAFEQAMSIQDQVIKQAIPDDKEKK